MQPFSIEIHFPFSRSKIYPDTLKHARLFSDFRQNPNILKITDIDELFGRWDDFSIVIFNTTKWAGTTVFFCGKPLLPYKNSFFYALLDVKRCYGQYKENTDKVGYCSESDWGCHRLNNMGRYFKGLDLYMKNPWYKYGHFIDAKTWAVDKSRIFEVLSEEAFLTLADTCPGYNPERIRQFVLKLPDQITIDDNWEIEYKLDVESSGLKGLPVSINFVADPEPEEAKRQEVEDDFLDPLTDIDRYLDKILRDRDKNRKDDFSDLL